MRSTATDPIPKKVKHSSWLPHGSLACSAWPLNFCGWNIIDSLTYTTTTTAQLLLFLEFSTFSAILAQKSVHIEQ